jgi:CHASE3 domain sensor protein
LPGTGFLGLRYWQERQAAILAHERSRQVLETLDRLKSIIADVEAQRRGYLLTLDPSYLKAYGVADESVRRDAQALQALVVGDPLQNHRAGHLAVTVAAKLREIDDIVKTAQNQLRAGSAGVDPQPGRDQIADRPDGGPRALPDRGIRRRRAEALEQRKAWLIATGSRHRRSPGRGGVGARTA